MESHLFGCDGLVFGAHPDDAEIGMGGIISQQIRLGRRLVLCDLTAGEMSSNGNQQIRHQEAVKSANTLGVSERICLGFADRGMKAKSEELVDIVRVIREYRPKVVFSPWHRDSHPDHRITTELVREGVLNARLRHYSRLSAWAVEKVWEYFINEIAPDPFYICLQEEDGLGKLRALACYRSQFRQEEGSIPTRLHSFLYKIELRDKYAGSLMGFPWAEGLWQNEPLALADPMQLILAEG
ncbi:MAG: bacillithiol biosynthesis deacetylase BshB1 [Desulfitobacteriaceae bacterium]